MGALSNALAQPPAAPPKRKRRHIQTPIQKSRQPPRTDEPAEPASGPAENLAAADTAPPISTEAAETLIEAKRIGERIKHLRQRKQMGLVELGRHTGLSASFLSQLETGRVVPTLRNLARVAMVFSKDLSYFFEPERPELFRILRASARQRLPQTGVEEPGYFYESLGHIPPDQSIAHSIPQPIAPYVAEFLAQPARDANRAVQNAAASAAQPAPRSSSHCHEGREFLYMLSGRLQLAHDAAIDTLEQGDAVYFDSSAPHSYERLGDEPCTAMILTLPEPPRGYRTGSRIPLSRAAGKATSSAGKKR